MTDADKITTKEKLIEFIYNLTNEECEIIITSLKSKGASV